MLRIFHLEDFPEEIFRVQLPSDLTKELIDTASKVYGTRKNLSKIIKSKFGKGSEETIRGYRNGRYFLPLWFISELVKILNKNGIGIHIRDIEKKVIAFRGPRGSPISCRLLPRKEDIRIVRLFFHLIGDGHLGGDVSSGRVPMYSNSDKTLIQEFKNDLSFFGDVPTRKYVRKKEKCRTLYMLEFPKVIGHIMRHLYKVKTGCKNVRLSKFIFCLPKKMILEGIRIYGDDEGSQKDNEIHFYSSNRELLNDFIKLIKTKLPEIKTVTEVRISRKEAQVYYFAILSEDLEIYRKSIGFKHKEKKERLDFWFKCKERDETWSFEIKNLILKSLLKKPKTSYEIAKTVTRLHWTVNWHIRNLRKQGLIQHIQVSKQGRLWNLTEKGKDYIKNYNSRYHDRKIILG